jgi:hypothetical protein
MKEYIVQVSDPAVWDTLHPEILASGGSTYIPNRAVTCVNERPFNDYLAHYELTDAEAQLLEQDPRVLMVELQADLRPGVEKGFQGTRPTYTYDKSTTTTANMKNWGLLRGTRPANPFGSGTSASGEFTYNLDGTGVDIIVIDTGVEPDHPEFAVNADGSGGSRVVDFNWYNLGVPGIYESSYYGGYMGDSDGHGSNCASIAAGNTCGWASGSKIYSIRIFAGTRIYGSATSLGAINSDVCFDLVRAFHLAKQAAAISNNVTEFTANYTVSLGHSIDATSLYYQLKASGNTNGHVRPTICTNSWGYRSSYPVFSYANYRGSQISITSYSQGAAYGMVNYQHPYSQVSYLDQSANNCGAAGVIMLGAAGNYYHKIDVPGGADYNNYYQFGPNAVYYHRGQSPTSASTFITVGAIDNATAREQKVYFSESGPRVDVYAPGVMIMGAYANKPYQTAAVADPRASGYYLNKISGTSQATPQVTGMLACVLQARPNMTGEEARKFIATHSVNGSLTFTGTDNYSNQNSLQGSANRILQTPFTAPSRGDITVS